jgi:hypothetical protein
MTSKRKTKEKEKDFPKAKRQKVGAKKLKPTTFSNIKIKSKSIHVSEQNLRSSDVIAQQSQALGQDTDQAIIKQSVTNRNLSLPDIINQLGHYNLKFITSMDYIVLKFEL